MNATINIKLKSLNIEPLAIAKYFYERGITSQLFIQKLIYFAFLKGIENNLLLFEEKFQAWKHGPVLRSVFERMTDKSMDLDAMFAQIFPIQEKKVLALLEKTYQNYKDCDVWDLVEESHCSEPWKKTRGELDENEASTEEIETSEIVKFVVKYYLENKKVPKKAESSTLKKIETDVEEIRKIVENTSHSFKKAEFAEKLSQLSPQEKKEIRETEQMLSHFNKARIKH